MIDKIMPTKLKKKRIVFIEDSLWSKIECLAKKDNISRSKALRNILRKNLMLLNTQKIYYIILLFLYLFIYLSILSRRVVSSLLIKYIVKRRWFYG